MSARLTIDSMRFARDGARQSGEVPIAALDRLLDILADPGGSLRYRLSGLVLGGRPSLRLEIDAVVSLVCQRCLGPYSQSIQIDTSLPIARNEAELARWERDDPLLDALLADPALDVLTLVEDEMLLGLPVVPSHPEGECALVGTGNGY